MAPRPHTAVMRHDGGQELRAFIYDRNSRLNPRGGRSVEDQRLENRRFCESRGWRVADEFDDPGYSASRWAKTGRPDYEQMISRIDVADHDKECDVLVVWEASRAYRSTRAYLDLRDLCEQRGVLLCLNGTVYDLSRGQDRFVTGLGALTAELEADAIRDRNLRTVRLNAERGGPHGRIPYGYRREYDPLTGALQRQVVDEDRAVVVRELAQRVAAGQSLFSIVQDLNGRGVPSPRGGNWSLTTVRNLVTRPTNIGKRQHAGEVIGDAAWEPILDDPTYYACLKLVSDPARLTHKDSAIRHLLSGVPVCGPCLYALAQDVRVMRPIRIKGTFAYTCRTCYRATIRAELLEGYVTRAMLTRIERPSFASSMRADVADVALRRSLAQADALEAQLAEARTLASTMTSAGRMALSAVSLAALEGELLPQVEAARQRAMEATLPPVLRRAAGPGARKAWAGMDLMERRALLRAVVRVTVHRAGRGARGLPPGRVTLGWLH